MNQVLSLLDDEKWHDIKEIIEETYLTEERVDELLNILENVDIVEKQEKIEKAKVGELGSEVLNLSEDI